MGCPRFRWGNLDSPAVSAGGGEKRGKVAGMAAFSQSDDLRGAEFVDVNLRGARFVRSNLSGAVMRGVDVAGADIDAPWLFDGGTALHVNDLSVLSTAAPSYAEVLEVRAGREAMVRDFLVTVTPDDLSIARKNPWAPSQPETTLACLHTILDEEWEHHRYAIRDLDAIVLAAA